MRFPRLRHKPTGTPAAVEKVVANWRAEGSPAQAAIAWKRGPWVKAFPSHRGLFDQLPEPLSRADVTSYVKQLPHDPDGAVSLLLASLAWGYGRVGYGPKRAQNILAGGPTVGENLNRVRGFLTVDPVAGYVGLATDHRIDHLGPAFGTKYLHFASPPSKAAPILDRLVAEWFKANVGMRLAAAKWDPGSYALYCKLLSDWSESLGLELSQLEMIIFHAQAKLDGSQWGK